MPKQVLVANQADITLCSMNLLTNSTCKTAAMSMERPCCRVPSVTSNGDKLSPVNSSNCRCNAVMECQHYWTATAPQILASSSRLLPSASSSSRERCNSTMRNSISSSATSTSKIRPTGDKLNVTPGWPLFNVSLVATLVRSTTRCANTN